MQKNPVNQIDTKIMSFNLKDNLGKMSLWSCFGKTHLPLEINVMQSLLLYLKGWFKIQVLDVNYTGYLRADLFMLCKYRATE